jgi:hypothetical protein
VIEEAGPEIRVKRAQFIERTEQLTHTLEGLRES